MRQVASAGGGAILGWKEEADLGSWRLGGKADCEMLLMDTGEVLGSEMRLWPGVYMIRSTALDRRGPRVA